MGIKLSEILPGKKTYAAALAVVLGAAASFFGGEITKPEAIQLVTTGLLAMLLRSGVKAEATNMVDQLTATKRSR